jgi:hypothetical protein
MRSNTSTKLLVLIATVTLLLPGLLLGQSTTQGAMSGTITDPTGAVVANVTVKLTNLKRLLGVKSKPMRRVFINFPWPTRAPTRSKLSAAGFKTYSAKAEINVGQVTVVNAKLEVGTAIRNRWLRSRAAGEVLQTEAADMSTNFDRNLVENLPNGGNDLTAVAYTAPGINMNTGGGYGNFNVNGLPATSNVFTVDGENQMDPFLNLNNSGPDQPHAGQEQH